MSACSVSVGHDPYRLGIRACHQRGVRKPQSEVEKGSNSCPFGSKDSQEVMPPIPITTTSSTVKLTKKVMIQPFAILHLMGLCQIPLMAKGVEVMVEAREEPFSDSVTTVNSYLHIKQGSTWVPLGPLNLTCRVVAIPAKTVVARVKATNEALPGPAHQVSKREDNEMG